MQSKRERSQQAMTLLPPLESFIPPDHYLRRLNQVLDLSFVHETVRDIYCQDNGRPSIDPEVIIRLFLIQALEGIPHVRDLMRQVQMHLGYRWFIGYELDEKLPDHSTLSRALDRFGDEIFDELFKRSISQCQASGLIEGKVLHVDATTIRADININKVDQPNSSDKDARFGRFPDGKKHPGYKQHAIADGQKRVVVGVSVTPANSPDDSTLEELVDKATDCLGSSPEAICADGGYGSGRNRAQLERRDVRLVSPPQRAKSATGKGGLTVENFDYCEDTDEFICPAGERLRFHGFDSTRPGRRIYIVTGRPCVTCSLQPRCTKTARRKLRVGPHHSALIRLRTDSKTDDFKRLYSQRAPVIEGVFAESKQWHSLGRAWRRGLSKTKVQCLLVATVLNLKRLANVSGALSTFFSLLKALMRQMRTATAIERDTHHPFTTCTGHLHAMESTYL